MSQKRSTARLSSDHGDAVFSCRRSPAVNGDYVLAVRTVALFCDSNHSHPAASLLITVSEMERHQSKAVKGWDGRVKPPHKNHPLWN